MNTKIKEIAYRVKLLDGDGWNTSNLSRDVEKFANLIINECIDVLHTEQDRLDSIPGREMSAQGMELAKMYINNHFMRHEVK